MSLVSVIMPYYSKRSYLENSLNSVLNQSYKNLEIILVNDEMDLETKKFLQTISKKDMRIKLINNDKNLVQVNQEIKQLRYQMVNILLFVIVMISGKRLN